MKTLRTILEMGQYVRNIKKSSDDKSHETIGNHPIKPSHRNKISDHNGHEIHMTTDKHGETNIHATNKHGVSQMHIRGKLNNKNLTVHHLSGRDGSSIKAHDLYHHLIHKHDMGIATQDQSPGGFKVWQKLHKMDNIQIHSHNIETGETKHLKKLDNHNDVHYDEKSKKSNKSNISNILIAKKGDNNG